MRILFLAAEAAPLVKVGGLADIVGSLPKAIAALGHDVRVAIPGYGGIDWPRWRPQWRALFPLRRGFGEEAGKIWETEAEGIAHLLVTGPPIPRDSRVYGSGIEEDGPKFVFFSLAALWGAQAVGWQPDVVHAHDSHTGQAAGRLATEGRLRLLARSSRRRGGPLPRLRHSRPRLCPRPLP